MNWKIDEMHLRNCGIHLRSDDLMNDSPDPTKSSLSQLTSSFQAEFVPSTDMYSDVMDLG